MKISGKLKKTLKSRCEDCGAILQIRTMTEKALEYGEEICIDEDYVVCPRCGEINNYERGKNRRRRQEE